MCSNMGDSNTNTKEDNNIENKRLITNHENYNDVRLKKHDITNCQRGRTKGKVWKILKPPYFLVALHISIIFLELFSPEWLRQLMILKPMIRWEIWRLLTYSFVHIDFQHLALNTIVALSLGWVLEREQSWWRLAIVWIFGVISGAFAAILFQPENTIYGESGAVYALLISHIPNVLLKKSEIKMWWFRLFSVCILVIFDLIFFFLENSFEHNLRTVAWSSHAFGALTGFLISSITYRGVNESNVQMQALMWTSLFLISTLYMSAIYLIFFNN